MPDAESGAPSPEGHEEEEAKQELTDAESAERDGIKDTIEIIWNNEQIVFKICEVRPWLYLRRLLQPNTPFQDFWSFFEI